MPRATWTAKDERMLQHVKDACYASGRPRKLCTKIAHATVNKYLAVHGRTKTVGCHCPRGSVPLKRDRMHCYDPHTRRRRSRTCLPGAHR
jgi:hypothetical protein